MYNTSLKVGLKSAMLGSVKSVLIATILIVCSSNLWAEDWTTSDGINYKDVKVVRVEDDAITILYKDGGALVPIFKLSPELQERFDYDPVKAKAAAEARAKADADNAKELQAEIELAEKIKKEQQIKDANSRNQPETTAK
jgi:hypothetical protein